ncbi:GAF domain-containing protein [Rhodococcus sp. LB1]|uniref:GAF domain-containing protein n=1 Tax=Rhodococcus sp. LB1 TaxID=1807499 RepID=UPI00077A3A78|nr:histidine kinase [Rhodococcus sp. LB1]KXX59541.1 hypothetical protein AZG88_07265 [Rhodococcus sp. LB1]
MTFDESITSAALRALIDRSDDGLAILDPQGRFLAVNPAGCHLLGAAVSDLIGRRSAFDVEASRLRDGSAPARNFEGSVWIAATEIEFELAAVDLEHGCGNIVRFGPTSSAVRDTRALEAFTRTAATIAYENRLDVVLDKLAEEVRETVGMATCAVILVDEKSGSLRHAGTSGLPEDYGERIEQCRLLGAPLATTRGIEEARVIIARGFVKEALADPRWKPVHAILRTMDWDTYIVAPLIAREKVIGALGGFLTEDREPDKRDIRFIAAMADQAAIAVANARMLSRLELQAAREERRKLARDMHDSVTQALFSLSLRTKALELSVKSGEQVNLPEQLSQIHTLVTGAQAEMRALIMHRRPAPLDEEGFVSAVRKHLAAVAAREDITISVECDNEFYELDATVEEDLFMVISEAMHNVVKHSRAQSASVRIRRDDDDASTLTITVVDDGVGIPDRRDSQGTYGLLSMTERVTAHNGRITVTPGEGCGERRGTIVSVSIPCLTQHS